MGNSVAGQIRIDLIAQAAQFTAGMREGKQSLGSFREEFDRFNKSFDSSKNFEKRMAIHADAWKAAVKDMRLEMERDFGKDRYTTLRMNSLAAMTNIPVDQATRNQTRWKSMVPWGNSLRVELTREAAETAALLGQKKQTLVKEFSKSAQELAGAGLGAMGYGGIFGSALKFASSPLGAGTIGITAVAGTIAHAVRERDQLAREVRMYALQFGSSSESASRLLGSGIDEASIARVQRSFSQKSEQQKHGFSSLGLNPDALAAMPVEKALLSVGAAFEKIPNAADRAYLAFELFGRGGYQTIGTLQRMKEKIDLLGEREIIHPEDIERVKAWDRALNQAKDSIYELALSLGKGIGVESGLFTHMARGIELLGPLLKGDMKGLDKKLFRFQREDFNIEHANRMAMLKAGVGRETALGLESDYDAGRMTKEEYNEKTSEAIDKVQQETHRIEQEAEKRDQVAKKFQNINDKLFEMEYGAEASDRMKFERDLRELGIPGDYDSGGVLHGPLKDYMDRYDAGIQYQKDLKEGQDQEKNLDRQREKEMEDVSRADEERFYKEREMKKRLRSPEKILRDDLAELIDFKDSLTAEQYNRGRSQIAERYAGTLGGGEIRPVGMLQAGSAELHSLVTKLNMPDAKETLLRQTVELLRSIERELLEQRGEVLQ